MPDTSDLVRLYAAGIRESLAQVYVKHGSEIGGIVARRWIEEIAGHAAEVHGSHRAAGMLYAEADGLVCGGEAAWAEPGDRLAYVAGAPIVMEETLYDEAETEGGGADTLFGAIVATLRPWLLPAAAVLAAWWSGRVTTG